MNTDSKNWPPLCLVCLVSLAMGVALAEASEKNAGTTEEAASQGLSAAETQLTELLTQAFTDAALPVISNYCFDCHNTEYNEGGVRLDSFDPAMVRGDDAEHWRAVLDTINGGAKPPEDTDQPSDAERRVLVDGSLARSTRRGEVQPISCRLTKRQYTNTLRDLLQLPINLGQDLPDDSPSKLGFRNSSASQQTTSLHLQYYQSIAREALKKAIVTGERPTPAKYREGVDALLTS